MCKLEHSQGAAFQKAHAETKKSEITSFRSTTVLRAHSPGAVTNEVAMSQKLKAKFWPKIDQSRQIVLSEFKSRGCRAQRTH
jgi:hypothetical protein